MRRIYLIIEYDGTNYAGWQRQQNALSVQQVVEGAIKKLTGRETGVVGASRTDAGVHALGQAAHFDTDSRVPPEKFAFALNAMLPADVRVRESGEAAHDFHARFSSTGKLYRYVINDFAHPSALYRNLSAHSIYKLDCDLMNEACRDMVGEHDFKAFAAAGSVVRDTVRRVYSCKVSRAGDFITLFISGKGFLYNMVRILAGTLIQIGAGRLDAGAVARGIETGDRLSLGPTAPACGLTLMKVCYPGEFLNNTHTKIANPTCISRDCPV